MPMIKARFIKSCDGRNHKLEVAELLSRLTAEILHKDPAVTSVLVESADPGDWFVGGATIADQQVGTFYVELSITEHTNIKDETTEWVRRVYDGMNHLVGPAHEASYVLVHGVDGDAYGYGGLTQNLRWASRQR